MTIREIASYVIFLLIGLFGICIGLFGILHLEEPNYMILIGGIGITIIILMSVVDKKNNEMGA